MKTIIAGTDFTPSSVNACKYAALLAQKLQCKLVIFNLFQAPILHSNSGLYGISFASIKKTSETESAEVVKQLKTEFPSLKIDILVTSGGFKEELQEFIRRHQIRAVVMGLETKNRISKYIWGSHGIDIAGKINAPVITVPEKYKDHRLENMLIAVDNTEKLKSTSLKEIEKFSKATQSQVKLLHIRTPEEVFAPSQTVMIKFNGQKQEVEITKSRNIEDGIRFYSRRNDIDLVTIISRKHSVFYNLFRESVTKKVSYAANVPVMAIHE